ncbi:HAMP domain-containing sensor histidine kinase [Catenuloplanes atrovinosus]|uniref:histidine kinase n=1 Tax=Catenuloplanes atrovinosus TaxID=137266 RepID=A0AAE3YPH4_9ACTN|nr:HAMP domain-containing sensor histidine kinase [Catenuloplanes atrovinosus]MDR7276257.1 signal transduction histidine kinase [Catenuloplanes atrovinosus]
MRFLDRAGLRARVTTGFAAGALVLSLVMAFVSYQLVRRSLITERENTAVRAAYYDAAIVEAGVNNTPTPDIGTVLRSLDTGDSRRAVLQLDGQWHARSADLGLTAAIPAELQRHAATGRVGVQRVRAGGGPALVVAVPLRGGAVFYEIDAMDELDRTLRLLALILTVVALGTAGTGALIGWNATRYVLRPLTRVANAAQEITAGRHFARLDPAAEPDLARLTTSFNLMVDQLSARMERDRRFAADVSHELRSPLQTLAAAASVLDRRRDSLDDRTALAAGLVVAEVDRFQRLVDDLLELARTDRPADRREVDVAELARQACRDHGFDPGIVTVVAGPVIWSVDRRRIRQLLDNLLDNAAGYGGGATEVRLTAGPERCRIEVDDEGPGVSPEDKPLIWDRFVRGRAQSSSRADGGGTGLGLALVAQHAAAHHGTAEVLDRPGGGARFRIDLPECL